MDDFSNGMNLFLMVVEDCTPGTDTQSFDALLLASDFDALVGGAAAAKLANICSLCMEIKVQISLPMSACILCSKVTTFCLLPHSNLAIVWQWNTAT